MKNQLLSIAVTSRAFSNHPELKRLLLSRFSRVRFNETGRQLSGDELKEFMKGAQAAIVSLEKLDEELLSTLPDLRLISKYGVGLDNVDFTALKRFPLSFAWKGGVNRRSVAELTLSFILLSLRKSFMANQQLKAGTWKPLVGAQLTGKTVGVIGCGHIGKEVIRLLDPFECNVLVHDLIYDESFCHEYGLQKTSLEELLRASDVVSLHVPLNNSTKQMLSRSRLEQLKSGAVLVNTARGGLVDEVALKERLKQGHFFAAFDVFAEEPATDLELLSLPNFFSTPHMGGSSEEAVLAMGLAAIEGLESALPIENWMDQNPGVF